MTACALFPDNLCGPVFRNTEIGGDVRDAAMAVIGHVGVYLSETHGGPDPLVLHAEFSGPAYGEPGPLLGHVRGARLMTASGELLRDFVVEPGNTMMFILVQTEFVQDSAEFERLRREFLAGRVLIELTTDLPGLETLRVPLPLQYASDWGRARCA
jgi:hypothetical protein